MVSYDSDKGNGSHGLFQIIKSIREHLCLSLCTGGVSLDEVSGLINQLRVIIHKAGRPLYKARTSVRPHFCISCKLFAVVGFPFGIRVRIARMIICIRGCVIMGVAEYDN